MDRVPRKKKKQIPKDTFYCYVPASGMIYPKNGLPYFITKPCVFYKHIDGLDGYCSLLKCEVIDRVKSCGEREGI